MRDPTPLEEAVARGVHVVLNPAAGQPEPALAAIGGVLGGAGVGWAATVLDGVSDPVADVRAAVADGAGLVAAYGGDGTVAAAAEAVIGTDAVLAVLPGGTANAIARELGVPGSVADACRLFCAGDPDGRPDGRVGAVDAIGLADGTHALLQVGAGVHAAAIAGADREAKDSLGTAAYALEGLRAIRGAPTSRYRLHLDGAPVEAEGVACLICNGGAVGFGPFALAPEISMRDGELDVLVLHDTDVRTLLALARDMLLGRPPGAEGVRHWRAESVRVEMDPPQSVQRDGNPAPGVSLAARVLPSALRVVVPTRRSAA